MRNKVRCGDTLLFSAINLCAGSPSHFWQQQSYPNAKNSGIIFCGGVAWVFTNPKSLGERIKRWEENPALFGSTTVTCFKKNRQISVISAHFEKSGKTGLISHIFGVRKISASRSFSFLQMVSATGSSFFAFPGRFPWTTTNLRAMLPRWVKSQSTGEALPPPL